jgi:hypothetical protein
MAVVARHDMAVVACHETWQLLPDMTSHDMAVVACRETGSCCLAGKYILFLSFIHLHNYLYLWN